MANDTTDGLFARIGNDLDIGSRPAFYGLLLLGAVLMWGVTFVASTFWIKVLYAMYMYMVLSIGWNYLSGYTGYATFGPMLFIGSGAYATAFFKVHAGWPWFYSMAGAVVVSAILAAVLGVVLLRISGIYFAIGTLLVAEAAREAVLLEDNLLGGSTGISIGKLPIEMIYLLFAALVLVSLVVMYETATSRFGLRMLAIREDEDVLGTLGVNPIKYKVPAFVVHGVLTSLGGSAFALSLGFVFPTTVFSVDITITLILVAILGGIGTVWGPVIGTLILIPFQELFWMQFPSLHIVVYGAFLVAVIILMPEGLISKLKEKDILPHTRGI